MSVDGRVDIVDLRPRHIRALMRIDAQVYAEPWSRQLWRTELRRERRVYIAAVEGHVLVGYAGALLSVDEAHVTTIVTDPAHQRSGVGARLMHELVERCLAAGAEALTLEVRVSNTAAQALYRRFGLAPVGVRKGYYETEQEDAIIMWAHDIAGDDYRRRLDAIASELAERRGAAA